MVNVTGNPLQGMPLFVKVGVTVMLATEGVDPPFEAVNDGMFPNPEDANPMVGLSLTQE